MLYYLFKLNFAFSLFAHTIPFRLYVWLDSLGGNITKLINVIEGFKYVGVVSI
jgi:hypothetical protein